MTRLPTAAIGLGLLVLAGGAEAQQFEFRALGGHLHEDAPQAHAIFGPAVIAAPPTSISQSGSWAELGLSYNPGSYRLHLSAQDIAVDIGRPLGFPFVAPEMGIEGRIVDLAYARDLGLPGIAAEWSLGLRHVEIGTSVDDFFAGSGPQHDFRGNGLRLGAAGDGSIGASGRIGWFGAAGLSMVPGSIETTPRDTWFCLGCTPIDVTALAADLRLGGTYEIATGLSLLAGYQAQYWRDVTVAVSDTTGIGTNEGTSDLLLHGLYLGVAARW